MRSILLVALVAMALVATPGALACGSSPSNATLDANGERYYVTNDICQLSCLFSVHVYRESNSQAGLQRADSQVDNTCGGTSSADQRIF